MYTDRVFLWASQPFLQWASPLLLFTLFQILLWTGMIALYYKTKERNKLKYLSLLIGTIILFETHHLIEAILSKSYYSGVFTATAILLIGFPLLLWRKKR